MLSVRRDGGKVDAITLQSELARRGELDTAGGKVYIGHLIDFAPPDNVLDYARLVVQGAQSRRLASAARQLAECAERGQQRPTTLIRDFMREAEAISVVEDVGLPRAIPAASVSVASPAPFLVDDLLVKGEIAIGAGESGAKKSTIMVHVAAAIAGGYPVFEQFTCRCAPVLIVSAEDPAEVITNRLRAFAAGHGWDAAQVLGNVHILAGTELSLTDSSFQWHLTREVTRLGAGLLILDPLADLLGTSDESSNTDGRAIVRFLRRLGRRTGVVPYLNHHTGKAVPGKRAIDRIRGASAYVSAARCVLFFEESDAGTTIYHLKMSRAPKLRPFELLMDVKSESANNTTWTSATLRYAVEKTGKQAAKDQRAEKLVLDSVSASPRQLNTSDLKRAALGTGVTQVDVSNAISALEKAGTIAWAEGERGAHLWYPITLPADSGNDGEISLPTLPQPCRATSESHGDDLAPPIGWAGKVAARTELADSGQSDLGRERREPDFVAPLDETQPFAILAL